MKRIRALFDQRRARTASHPFFEWLGRGDVPLASVFAFSPVMVDFTMGFADMNKWFLSYPEPRNEFERSINQHTLEDRTHSQLFVENWHALALDETLRWSPSKTLWWLYSSRETLPIRRFGWEIMGLAVFFPDPLVRFALMEAVEICGDVFFRNTARMATRLSARTGIEYRYYGEYHQLRETGHLHTDESPFFAALLSTDQINQASEAVMRIFTGFEQVLDQLLGYCHRMSTQPEQLMRSLQLQYEQAMIAPELEHGDRLLDALNAPPTSHSQAPLVDYLAERKAQLANHPLLGWLASNSLGSVEKLRSFSALWATDIAGYADFNQFALSYPAARNGAEQAINHVARSLSSHGLLYLQDWRALQLDESLKWSSGETIAFYFLSEQSEIHRRNLAKVTQFAFQNASPLSRLWLALAFETGGDPLFDALKPTVAEAEQLTSPLNYWAERHGGTQQHLDRSTLAPLAALLSQDVTAVEQRRISGMISSLFDNFEEQFTLSHQQAMAGTFLQAPGTLPPLAQRAPRATVMTHKAVEPSAK